MSLDIIRKTLTQYLERLQHEICMVIKASTVFINVIENVQETKEKEERTETTTD